MTKAKNTRRLPRVEYCPYVSDHICTIRHGTPCPGGCRLPRRCETCGDSSCGFFDMYDSIDGVAYCWIPPYWYDKIDNTDPDEGGEE